MNKYAVLEFSKGANKYLLGGDIAFLRDDIEHKAFNGYPIILDYPLKSISTGPESASIVHIYLDGEDLQLK